MTLRICNRDARALWLDAQGLGEAPTGALDVLQIIKSLGFVQLDSIQNVTRAHHHILWSRNQNYREPMLDRLLAKDRGIFEHFSHDACVLPMEFFPMWTRQFKRLKARLDRSGASKTMLDAIGRAAIRRRIADEGPLSTHAFGTKIIGKKKMWSRPPHKQALDYMWYCGELSTHRRENFNKFYDLAERVFTADLRNQDHSDQYQIDWLCEQALQRLVFASPGEIQRFWEAVDPSDVSAWAKRNAASLVDVEVQAADGSWFQSIALGDIEARLAQASPPTSRLRLLNPFDPAIRDRTRLARLFGFDYRIEVFVPSHLRRWGYYVYPLLEGGRFVGRVEVKANRKAGHLDVVNFWPEPRVSWGVKRWEKLNAELVRLARLAGVDELKFRTSCGDLLRAHKKS